MPRPRPEHLALYVAALVWAGAAAAQPVRLSPGPLTRAHASLEGVTTCGRCHEAGRGVSAEKCLACHAPIAQRISARRGVHRGVSGACTPCHREHGGVDADLRRLDPQAFDHRAETGFALEGEHAKLAARCQACHKVRSYIAARPACQSCHTDPHKAVLGDRCTRCHSTAVPFKEARRGFDHATARFALTGSHRSVACEKCHRAGVFRGLQFDRCAACHTSPHRESIAGDCRSCHKDTGFRGASFDHSRTRLPLAGKHAALGCRKCHTSLSADDVPLVQKVADFGGVSATCVKCHQDQHKGAFGLLCDACHLPTMTFKAAGFVHPRSPEFFAGRHAGVACVRCHVRASGLPESGTPAVVRAKTPTTACSTCHADVHLGQVGDACQRCHDIAAARFAPSRFSHDAGSFPLAGRHRTVECAKCHPAVTGAFPAGVGTARRLSAISHECQACHKDVHLGQVGTDCQRCHDVDAERFGPTRFSHDAGEFALTGKHRTVQCAKCHPSVTATFPAGAGTARRLNPMSRECRSCHGDPHLGQVDGTCVTCHSTETFKMPSYPHRGQELLFSVANHGSLPCRSCHKVEAGSYPAGRGTTLRFKVGRGCLDCHRK